MDIFSLLPGLAQALRVLAKLTGKHILADLADFIDVLLQSPQLLDWFKSKVAADAAGTLSIEGDPPEAIVQEVRERRIDWAKWIALLPTLLEVAKAFRGFAQPITEQAEPGQGAKASGELQA